MRFFPTGMGFERETRFQASTKKQKTCEFASCDEQARYRFISNQTRIIQI
jgi:hypothetical protein